MRWLLLFEGQAGNEDGQDESSRKFQDQRPYFAMLWGLAGEAVSLVCKPTSQRERCGAPEFYRAEKADVGRPPSG